MDTSQKSQDQTPPPSVCELIRLRGIIKTQQEQINQRDEARQKMEKKLIDAEQNAKLWMGSSEGWQKQCQREEKKNWHLKRVLKDML